MSLTPKQKAVLEYIRGYQGEFGYSPTQNEIAKHFGYQSLGTVQNYLVRLERDGHISKNWNARRDLKLAPLSAMDSSTTPQSTAVTLDILGRVAAGSPIESFGSSQTLDVPLSFLGKGDHYVLQVKGDSMIDEGILEGDYVVVQKHAHPTNGQVVVALLENEATVKRFYRNIKSEQIELHAANAKYSPILVDPSVRRIQIEGIVVGVLRKL